ncbi:hypothetical protein HMPREF1052_0158 [Pasteurella bettyae CCUG 2042]|uniref:Uncharacterized protein n=1 Tax=Pasteurella bettyae CCUG 2042 TaxID=1095749 RepID=I3DIK7_9PAST|nr:hypothetical protein HMPREF1052_0158 [Pasteurella bettyae CCUG 2042]
MLLVYVDLVQQSSSLSRYKSAVKKCEFLTALLSFSTKKT